MKSYPMAAPAFSIQDPNAARLADPALREGLLKLARRRLPPAEVEDLVQNILAEALVAQSPPRDAAEFQRWVYGIARHKIADVYRRRGRLPVVGANVDLNAAPPTASIGELEQWVESELPKTANAEATLHWLLREGDGETLDEIARDVALPATRVRQRVSRLRRHLHARWLALGAAGLISLLGLGALLQHALRRSSAPDIAREPLTPFEQASKLRRDALEHCAAGQYSECLARLDEAKGLDPNGENASAIVAARAAAKAVQRTNSAPELPAGSPVELTPDGNSTPSKRLNEKLLPLDESNSKQFVPNKPLPNRVPKGATPKQNALPSKAAPPGDDDGTGGKGRRPEPSHKKL